MLAMLAVAVAYRYLPDVLGWDEPGHVLTGVAFVAGICAVFFGARHTVFLIRAGRERRRRPRGVNASVRAS